MTAMDTAIRAVVCFGWAIAGWQGHVLWSDSKERIRAGYERDVTRAACLTMQRLFPDIDISDADCKRAGDRVMELSKEASRG